MKEWPSFAISVFGFQYSFELKECLSAVSGAIVPTASRSALSEVHDRHNAYYKYKCLSSLYSGEKKNRCF